MGPSVAEAEEGQSRRIPDATQQPGSPLVCAAADADTFAVRVNGDAITDRRDHRRAGWRQWARSFAVAASSGNFCASCASFLN